MSKEDNKNQELIAIKRIKVQSFYVNELAVDPNPSRILKVELGQRLGFVTEANLVDLTLRVYYHYPDAQANQILTDISVQNIFEIPNLSSYLKQPSEIKLPENIIIAIVSLSISHTRALLAQNLAGTPLQENIMSIVNPVDIAKFFYPNMFYTETPIEELIKEAE